MKNSVVYVRPELKNGKWIFRSVNSNEVINVPIRDIMAQKAHDNGQVLCFDYDSQRARRVDPTEASDTVAIKTPNTVEAPMEDPILNFIHNFSI